MSACLTIVVPCYNEEENIVETAAQLSAKRSELIAEGLINENSRILFVDDGSTDASLNKLQQLVKSYPFISILKLSKNFGHQNALLAGLLHAKDYSDCVISIDADLQDDVEALKDFVKKYKEGYEIVYGVRSNRDSDSWFKRTSARFFYMLMKAFGAKLIYNHADYRLVSKRVLENLNQFNEKNLFLRNIFPLIGFKSTQVNYIRKERFAGESKYPLGKMLKFAWTGISSFSSAPLHFIALLGLVIFLLSIVMSIYVLYRAFISHHVVPGWASTLISVYFLGGIQLLSIGVIGEYLAKNYIETKSRPRYFIDEYVDHDSV